MGDVKPEGSLVRRGVRWHGDPKMMTDSVKMDAISPRKYFSGRSVLITGATGFLGRIVVAKLLSEVPLLRSLHLLVRPRERSSGGPVPPETRVESEILAGPVFAALLEKGGPGFSADVKRKVRCVPGDLAAEDLGLSEATRSMLIANVDHIIHCGASVVFDERLDRALATNVRGAAGLLQLAKAAGATYTHVSTAYVCGRVEGLVTEALPSAPLDGAPSALEELIALEAAVDAVRREQLSETEVARALVALGMKVARERGWNDTYSFTKALAERVIVEGAGGTAVAIVRPSIIEACHREPLPGWIQGLRVADPLFIGFGRGRLDDFPASPDSVLDVVPADGVARTVLVAAAAASVTRPLVVHCATGSTNPLTLGALHEITREHFLAHPFVEKDRVCAVPNWSWPTRAAFERRARRRRRVATAMAAVAGKLGDSPRAKRLRARARRALSGLDQLAYYLDVYLPYMTLTARFETVELSRLMNSLHAAEADAFTFRPEGIDWRQYFLAVHLPGLRHYVLGMDAPRPTLAKTGGPLRFAAKKDSAHAALFKERAGQSAVRLVATILTRSIVRGIMGLEVVGRERVPQSGPFILAANHQSHLDTVVIREALGARAASLYVLAARDYFFDTRVKAWIFSALFKTLPIERHRPTRAGLELCGATLDRGFGILVYPEGSRSRDGSLKPFKPGIGVLAVELDVPLIPVRVEGTFESLPTGRWMPRRRRLSVVFGDQVSVGSPEGDLAEPPGERRRRYRYAAERVEAAIRALGISS